jgi:hypothetical protein
MKSKGKACKKCGEQIKESNVKRHERVCGMPRRIPYRGGFCEKCDANYRYIKGHKEKCKGYKRTVIYKRCEKCEKEFARNNIGKHMEKCMERVVDRRNNKKYKESLGK